ncbi:MAG TPA: PA0069 family radical SAM protein [Steroidobacteraceae bacterium]|jgi:DNA repair photolyase|nr:PA0069 family radical SAM protein [Steroidobacteraceae bacterium]
MERYTGRGALSNPPPRFLHERTEAADDDWYREELPESIATEVRAEPARTIIARNDSPDIAFEQSINPYRGCEHGCPYCYARPSHAYMDLSPGIDFETKIFFKADAARLLEQELGRRGYAVKPVTLGANTDPYQPLERKLRVTRSLLEVLERVRHPVSIVTKGALILRDLDLLRSLARDNLINVFVSITTLDAELKRLLEPRAASPQARVRVVRELTGAGVPTGVLVAPVIPAVNDHEIEAVVGAAAEAGAVSAHYVLLRLPHELKQIFRQWLDEHLPERSEHVMSLIRGARGGRENDPQFGSRMVGSGAWAQLLRDRFALAVKRHGLADRRLQALSCAHFRPPGAGGQMSLPL